MRRALIAIVLICSLPLLYGQKERNDASRREKKRNTESTTTENDPGSSRKKNQANTLSKGDKLYLFPTDSLYGNVLLGSPSDHSISLSVIARKGDEIRVSYSTQSGNYRYHTQPVVSQGEPTEIILNGLTKSTRYYYIVRYDNRQTTEKSFHTARSKGETFSFGIQGDSHPERAGKMFNKQLYQINLQNALSRQVDLYFAIGDDFSIDHLLRKASPVERSEIDRIYENHRGYFQIIGGSAPLFLVNGNHEQAGKYLLDGTDKNPAVYAANARNKYYPLPIPKGFYSGDQEQVEHIGFLRDYYSFEWGNALFLVIDPYWHSSTAVDNVAGGGEKRSNMWNITLGETQYKWLKTTLEKSQAKYKFVLSHHVLGTGRGGIECAPYYEWGGRNRNGEWEFTSRRAGWAMPIHDLLVKNRVTIFFQGHDHLFAQEEKDGVIYQTLPCPADPSYSAFNANAFRGKILPNSGYLNVTVAPDSVQVEYIGAVLPGDETESQKNNTSKASYTIR